MVCGECGPKDEDGRLKFRREMFGGIFGFKIYFTSLYLIVNLLVFGKPKQVVSV